MILSDDPWDKPLLRIATVGVVGAGLSLGVMLYEMDKIETGPSSPPAVARAYALEKGLHPRYFGGEMGITINIDELIRPEPKIYRQYHTLQQEYDILIQQPEIKAEITAYRDLHQKREDRAMHAIAFGTGICLIPLMIGLFRDCRKLRQSRSNHTARKHQPRTSRNQ